MAFLGFCRYYVIEEKDYKNIDSAIKAAQIMYNEGKEKELVPEYLQEEEERLKL